LAQGCVLRALKHCGDCALAALILLEKNMDFKTPLAAICAFACGGICTMVFFVDKTSNLRSRFNERLRGAETLLMKPVVMDGNILTVQRPAAGNGFH